MHLTRIAFFLGGQLAADGVNNGGAEAVAENPPAVENLPTDGSGWVELFVSEMMNASNMDDARARASRTLEVLERSIITRAGAEALESFHKVFSQFFVGSTWLLNSHITGFDLLKLKIPALR